MHTPAWKKLLRALRNLALFVLALLAAGALYQGLAGLYDQFAYPPPGQMVDVNGTRLHLYCLGEGSPTVILEAGLGDNVLGWELVHARLAESTRVCAYDRPGLGWSEGLDRVIPSEEVAQILHTLLQEADIPGPYILVGHSMGGLHVRSFARLYPAEVTGLVLVDSSHENQLNAAHADETIEGILLPLKACQALAPIGVIRLVRAIASQPENTLFPPGQARARLALQNRSDLCRVVANEYRAVRTDTAQPAPPASLGDLPLVVITAGIGIQDRWQSLQDELAALSTNSTHIIAENSPHYIQFYQPELVIDAVMGMLAP
ncbi:MAG: alpha/beta fold hydrolase [Chloroflexota bacterium]